MLKTAVCSQCIHTQEVTPLSGSINSVCALSLITALHNGPVNITDPHILANQSSSWYTPALIPANCIAMQESQQSIHSVNQSAKQHTRTFSCQSDTPYMVTWDWRHCRPRIHGGRWWHLSCLDDKTRTTKIKLAKNIFVKYALLMVQSRPTTCSYWTFSHFSFIQIS